MKLLVVNGSPRGRKSNSEKILKWLFTEQSSNNEFSVDKIYAAYIKDRVNQIKLIDTADSVLVIFPLYTDGMPGVVKEIFEHMENIKESLKGKSISFIVHSGFPEAKQSRAVQKYTKHLAALLQMNYLGTVVMPGSEALSMAPDSMFKKKFESYKQIGSCIITNKAFDEAALKVIAGKEELSSFEKFVLKHIKISDIFWNRQLKQNNAYDKRFDKPYR